MPKITKSNITATYAPEEIAELIQEDLLNNFGIDAKIAEIKPVVSGGTKDCTCSSYSGGWSSDRCTCPISPVKFVGYSITTQEIK